MLAAGKYYLPPISEIPEKFYRDQDVLKAVLEAGLLNMIPLENIPRRILMDHISKDGLEKYPHLTDDLEIVIAAIGTDPSQLKYASTTLLANNVFKSFCVESKYELMYYGSEYWAKYMVQRVLGPEPSWEFIPWVDALECVGKIPKTFHNILKNLFDVAFAVYAVRRNKDVYFELPSEPK